MAGVWHPPSPSWSSAMIRRWAALCIRTKKGSRPQPPAANPSHSSRPTPLLTEHRGGKRALVDVHGDRNGSNSSQRLLAPPRVLVGAPFFLSLFSSLLSSPIPRRARRAARQRDAAHVGGSTMAAGAREEGASAARHLTGARVHPRVRAPPSSAWTAVP